MGLWAFSERQRKPQEGPRHIVGTPSHPAQLLSGSPVPGHAFAGRQGGNSPCSTCVGGGTQLRLGEMPPQHSWPLRGPWGRRAQTHHRALGQGRWSQERSAWRLTYPHTQNVQGQSTTGKSFAEWWNRRWILPAIVILHEICSGINKNIDRNCLQRVLSPCIMVFRNTLMFRDTADVTWHVTHWAATFRNF